jgi:8-oxo-dGTP pyrophosphatase MutT (NUDIX family)
VLLTVRTQKVSTHKGQVSFPGGHIESSETAIEAALRETIEELGEGIGPIRVLGVAQTLPAITGTLVTPVLAYVEKDLADLQHLTPSSDEVDVVFTCSIAELTHPDYRSMEERSRGGVTYRMPVFGDKSEHRIWGLTAMILDPILQNVVMPNKPV